MRITFLATKAIKQFPFPTPNEEILTLRAAVSPGRTLATKGKKPLRATVLFSIKHVRPRDAYVKTSNGVTVLRLNVNPLRPPSG